MTLSIIIVNFKNPPLLRLALTSLARVLNTTISSEVIVVDSASTIETRNVIYHDCKNLFERLVLIPFTENTGYTRGVNEGLRRATGEHILILNPDIVVLSGTIEGMIAYADQHPSVGLIGPGLLNFDDTRQESCFAFYTPRTMLARRIPLPGTHALLNHFLMRDVDVSAPRVVDWVMGSALMVTRASLDRVGTMDERFFLYLSEVDWAHRFWENGFQVVYVPTVRMYHYHQRESKGRFGILDVVFKQQTRWHLKDAIHYFRKNGTSGCRPQCPQNFQQSLLTS